MPDTPKDTSLENYYYRGQLREHIIQFMAIFAGLKVSVGKNDYDSESNLTDVKILYGSRDRVVSHIFTEHTQNKMLRLPLLSANLTELQMAPERFKGMGQVRKDTKLPLGGTLPDDIEVHEQMNPVPYRATMELAVYTSNTDHNFQILEQILLLFNPILQVQVSDAFGDRQKIIEVELNGINLEENYPVGSDNRVITDTLTFDYYFYLTPPRNISDNVINDIKVRLQTMQELVDTPANLNEGEVDPFIISPEDIPPS